MVLIHEKILALLEQRRLKKRDLARALAVSPQTATDICKGRSAITLPHLRNLVAFFNLSPDYWLDEERLLPEEIDGTARRAALTALARSGLATSRDLERLLHRLIAFARQRQPEFLATHPDLQPDEWAALGFGESQPGSPRRAGTAPGAVPGAVPGAIGRIGGEAGE